ncbi:unnamed protein product [Tilletia caries]|nr:unnamed protein product [Tilletia caries]
MSATDSRLAPIATPPQTEDESTQTKRAAPVKAPKSGHADDGLSDNYIQRMLQKPDDLPPFRLSNIFNELQYVSTIVLFTTPILAAYGIWTTPLQAKTFWWSFVYYFLTGLGITAGYHRLWAHRAYNASTPLQYFLAFMGTGAMTPRDHFITALVTVGEGYHNFHHQFPMDYRNATKWYQYDPTKWFIATMSFLGLASHLHVFPDNEVRKGRLAMELQKLHEGNRDITWPTSANHLPVISWSDYQAEAKTRPLIVVSGFIHDVGSFMEQHPGGLHLLKGKIGKDATTAFQGGIYDHSNAAHNLLSMMRVGVLDGGYQLAKDQMDAAAAARTPELSEAESSGSEDESPGTPTEVEPITATTLTGTTVKVEVPPVHPKAREYVVPGEVYSIVKRGELKANRVAEANGGKVGALLWNKKNKATAATA